MSRIVIVSILIILCLLMTLIRRSKKTILIVGASGGLGRCIVLEALARGHKVSVLVRSLSKLQEAIGTMIKHVTVYIGDGTDPAILNDATKDVDVIISTGPPVPELARAVGEACVNSSTCKCVVWTAGSSNILEADGVTMHYKAFGKAGENFYRAHAPCIRAIQSTGATYIIWCPGKMDAAGKKSNPPLTIYTYATPTGVPMDYVSYEDAANVIIRAIETSRYYNKHITA
jgi:NAD(P)H-binding